ncbi:MAG TPA: M48 family metalloprotease [Alphaproteobacteria bacterium]|nr:M48 family metalloprotease [Alphaproteobacteria bacterium]
MPLDRARLRVHRQAALARTLGLLGGLALLLAALGWIVAGPEGVVWTVLVGILVLIFGQRVRGAVLPKLFGGQRLEPAHAPELHAALADLARRAGLGFTPALYLIPSPRLQAVAVGHAPDTAIGITYGLLHTLSREESLAVLAHEIAHIRQRDLWLMTVAATASQLARLLSLVGMLLLVVFLVLLPLEGRAADTPWLLLIFLQLAPVAAGLIQLSLSRTREFAADTAAVHMTGDAEALVMALRKLDFFEHSDWEEPRRRHWFGLLRTHPTTEERIARLERLLGRPPSARRPANRSEPPRPGRVGAMMRFFR